MVRRGNICGAGTRARALPRAAWGLCLVHWLATTTAQAAEGLAMPLRCEIRNGHVELQPSSEMNYAILGPREQKAVTACASDQPDQCRTWMAHKFDLDCDGRRVAWLSVVGAMAEFQRGRGWVKDGRLHFRMTDRGAMGPSPECSPAGTAQARNPRERRRPLAAQCAPRNLRHGLAVVRMPPGFAPVLVAGTRFTHIAAPDGPGALAPVTHESHPDTALAPLRYPGSLIEDSFVEPEATSPPLPPKLATTRPPVEEQDPFPNLPRLIAPPLPTVTEVPQPVPVETAVTAVPDDSPPASPAPSAPAQPSESPVVAAENVADIPPPAPATPPSSPAEAKPNSPFAPVLRVADRLLKTPGTPASALVPGLAALALLFGGIGALAVLRRKAARALLAQAAPSAPQPAETHLVERGAWDAEQSAAHACAAMIRTAASMHAAIRGQVQRLDGPELKATLLGDLGGIEQALSHPRLSHYVSARDWASIQINLAGILNDLEGIQQTLDEANAEHFLPHPNARMPATVFDAYAVLGVNADANDRVIKKIVDGLRQSWHPDLARDERDRRLREQRIKTINVAWEMIRRRRAPA